MNKLFCVVVGVAAIAATPTTATITLSTTGSGTGENVQFEPGALIPATSQFGDLNVSGTKVFFDTSFTKDPMSNGGSGTGQFFNDQGQGQASLICSTPQAGTACFTGGGNGMQLTSMEIFPQAGIGWGQLIANLDFGEGEVNVFARDNMGNNFNFMLTNGSNFFELTASNNEAITDVQITQLSGTPGPFGWNDLKQPRVNGVCTIGTATCEPLVVAAEPTSLWLLGGALSMLGFIGWMRCGLFG